MLLDNVRTIRQGGRVFLSIADLNQAITGLAKSNAVTQALLRLRKRGDLTDSDFYRGPSGLYLDASKLDVLATSMRKRAVGKIETLKLELSSMGLVSITPEEGVSQLDVLLSRLAQANREHKWLKGRMKEVKDDIDALQTQIINYLKQEEENGDIE